MHVFQILLDIVYPQFCAVCGRKTGGAHGRPVCPACLKLTTPLAAPLCQRCGMPLRQVTDATTAGCRNCRRIRLFFDRAISVFEYNPVMKIIIHQLKYRRKTALARVLQKRLGDVVCGGQGFPPRSPAAGQPERDKRVLAMVRQMDAEGFGNCTNQYECEAACPKEIQRRSHRPHEPRLHEGGASRAIGLRPRLVFGESGNSLPGRGSNP